MSASERPILFSGPMVRALLAGTKTQTRRAVTRLSEFGPVTEFGESTSPGYAWHFRNRRMLWNDVSGRRLLECCPYGVRGGRLWVRESWTLAETDYSKASVIFRADCDDPLVYKWRPSIHLKRIHARLTLEVTDLRVQRLQDISEEDARAEGVDPVGDAGPIGYRAQFERLWDAINGAGAWALNPWVWAVSFRRMP